MRLPARLLVLSAFLTCLFIAPSALAQGPAWVDLFNGKNLDGWVDVNTSPETWSAKDGLLVCTGKPIGVMRSAKMYENFILQIEWRHMEAGGNSGVFAWCDAEVRGNRLPNGVEVQMLENDWYKIHSRTNAYVSGELFGAGSVRTTPDNPRGSRSKSVELRCKGKGEWNQYTVVAVDGTIKLAINGKFVNGISKSTRKKGYLCLEAEGAEIHFRNIRIMELETGYAKPEEIAPRAANDQAGAVTPAFDAQKIDDISVGYGLAIGDVDGDRKPDILLADSKEVVWYKNPNWEKTVIAKDLTTRDNVCIAARDLDGDGKVEVAVGAMWNPGETTDTTKSGSIHYLIRPKDGKELWQDIRLPHEPTTHRMRWAKGAGGHDGFSLVVLPLHGRGNVRGTGAPVKALAYAVPAADKIKDPAAWKTTLIDDGLHSTHNFDLGPNDAVVIGGFEGVNVDGKPVLTKDNGSRGVGEVRRMRNGFATIEPMHGTDLVTYTKEGKGWKRHVLTDQLKAGHALAVGDVLGTGSECIAVGWRAKNKAGKFGVKLFVPGNDTNWDEHWVDDSIATEDLQLADLDGDGKPELIASGRSTGDVKIYWNCSK